MSSEAAEYEQLQSLERDDDHFQQCNESVRRSTVRLSRRSFVTLSICNTFLFVASAYIFFWAAAMVARPAPSEGECAKVVSPWSPLWEAVEFWEGNFENDFTHPSKYRGPPTLELQQTWNSLWGVRGIGVDKEGLQKLNKSDVDQYIQIQGSDADNPTRAGDEPTSIRITSVGISKGFLITWTVMASRSSPREDTNLLLGPPRAGARC
ncbi:hypothetical protein ED733_000181 [Metarhizium rileyi]|uniref:Uncharacterized protein n=1 Tax=Metarhizium rileyi (strain RCEF 4871) TaxID=1649241 RepID=A0A5C6G6S6_METRR|nr:hypothetical protein ED733_000181 [Metarhizium rileyi]